MLPLISVLSGVLPMIFYVCFLKRNKQGGFWVIFLYCAISFLTDNVHHELRDRSYIFYLNSSFTICEFGLFTLFIYLSLKNKPFKFFTLIGVALFLIIATINLLNGSGGTIFDSLSASAESILLIIFSIFFLYEQLTDPTVMYVYYLKNFWIVLAILLYFASTLFLFIYAATLTKQEYNNYWSINNFFNILKNILFSVAFLMKKSDKAHHSLDTAYADMQ
ncbi:MAG TPA: hypothetical protein VL727_10575 [Puia sp.]|nr:hypothetical protein [Puia sp.]